MNRRKFIHNTLVGFSGLTGWAIPAHAQERKPAPENAAASLRAQWSVRGPRLFHEDLREGPGFSLSYGGIRADLTKRQEWNVRTQSVAPIVQTSFHHVSGLTVIRRVKAYPEFEALTYDVAFKNESDSDLPALGPILAMDVQFGARALQGACVVSGGGGLDDATYPPEAFAIHQHRFGPMTPTGGELTLTTRGGRSSNKDLPFYFVQNDDQGEGMFVAIGWSGQWRSRITGNFHVQVLTLEAGIPDLHICLKPGEEIRGPKILLGCYQGELSSGSNRLRRLIRAHFTPLLDGETFGPVKTYDHWWNIDVHFDEDLLRRLAGAAAGLGQEYFLLDAGWYAGSNGPQNFSGGVGNWKEVDRNKFPSGLEPFAEYVRSKSLRFGLWFEPERVAKGTLLAREHADWVLWLPPDTARNYEYPDPNYGLLDYSRPEVVEWVRQMLDAYIRKLDIRYIRYDCNISPLPYWQAKDAGNRRGITEIRHMEGFYRLIDWIREHHPGVVLEGCASGGRRIDLETLSRFHTFWISDQTSDPDIVRYHLEGMNVFLPGNYGYVCYTLPLPFQKHLEAMDFGFQSFFGGAFGLGGRIDNWPAQMKEQARAHGGVYDKIRKFLVKDYYPLTPQPRDVYAWEAWQFHDPGSQEGFVQVFRNESSEESKHFALKALDGRAAYQFTDPYSGKSIQMGGAAAASRGLLFRAPKMSSQIFVYARKD